LYRYNSNDTTSFSKSGKHPVAVDLKLMSRLPVFLN
jgi:hypothetical protein